MRTLIPLLLAAALPAADDARAADHAALRALMAAATDALARHSAEALKALVLDDAPLTFVDQKRVIGSAELDAYFARWFAPAGPIAQVRYAATPARPAVFIAPDVAVADGTSETTYTLADGRSMVAHEAWTATLARRDGAWKIASLHAGLDPFDNPALTAQGTRLRGLAIAAGGVGLAVGIGLTLLARRRRPA